MTLDVLLLEDDPAKKGRLLSFLNSHRGTRFDRIDTALCTHSAMELMRAHEYDLLIADVIVPANLGGEPSEGSTVDLFTSIDERIGGIRPPKYSVAISASDGLTTDAREFFLGRPWGILKYDESTSETLTTIEKICSYIANERANQSVTRSCDVFIMTALMEPEFTALENAPGIVWAPPEPLDSIQFVRHGVAQSGDATISVSAAFAPRMGPVSSAVLAAKAVLKLNPKLIVMCGICAGVPNKTAIGDVVAADFAWDWQSGKYVDKNGEEHFEISPHHVPIDDRIRSALMLLKRESDFWNTFATSALEAKVALPKLIIGPIASGSAVLADARVSSRIKETQHRSLTGLDMEVYGVYAAAQASDPEMKFIALKSVCDLGDKQKDDVHQSYAAKVSAATAAYFVGKYAAELIA